jgi:hypothetical protein
VRLRLCSSLQIFSNFSFCCHVSGYGFIFSITSMKFFGVIVATVAAVGGDGGLLRPCFATSSSSSLWHAFDGIPIVLARPTNGGRKNQNFSSAVIHPDTELHSSSSSSPRVGEQRELQLPVDAEGELTNFTWDTTFNCPATVFCHPVCVATAADCPDDAVCPAGTEVC